MPDRSPVSNNGTRRINDFVIRVANVNGSGSASANSLLSRSIFRMGVPVSAKNIFPSNIQGLPTWYEVRANGSGHLGRSSRVDLLVSMNPRSIERDIASVSPGGYVLYDSTWPLPDGLRRSDLTVIGVPLTEMNVEAFPDPKIRILMKNITYVGATAALLNLDLETIRGLLNEIYAKKPHLSEANMRAIELSHEFVLEHFDCPIEMRVEPSDGVGDRILMNGNTACALGAIYAGATVAGWYPITPATSLSDSFRALCQRFREDPETGSINACIVQAEDELSAIGVAIGAGWAGARAFTATSGAGLSLMSEFLGFAYFTEIPVVIFDVQRAGPSTGMPTRTQQGDILGTAYASHGDTKQILLIPSEPSEAFDLTVKAFDLADRFQTPVIVLSDLDIGMNEWLCDPMEWDDSYEPDRGKLLGATELEGMDAFYRYLDSDGDGIPYRTIPGVDPKGAYFLRGSGHNKLGAYTEEGAEYVENADRLLRKFYSACDEVPEPITDGPGDADFALVSVGSCDAAIREVIDRVDPARKAIDYMRIRAFPFGDEVRAFIESHHDIVVVEQNRDAQLRALLLLEADADARRVRSILSYGGLSIDFEFLESAVKTMLADRGRSEYRNTA